MRVTEYARIFTWESLGCKDNDASLALLNAEIGFYETIYNESKDTLEEFDNIDCDLAIHRTKHRIAVTLQMLGFNWVFVDKTNKNIATLRRILNIKIVEASEF